MTRRLLALCALTAACGGSNTAPSPPSAQPPPIIAATPPAVPSPPPVVRDPARFSQVFWDQFVHDAFDRPGQNQPLRRFTVAPHLYIQINDGLGKPIDSATLDTVQHALEDVAAIWGGGQFGFSAVDRGTASHVGDANWITVSWYGTNEGEFCGQSHVGFISGEIDLNYLHPRCGCGASKITALIAKHELGHAFGYYHTDSASDVMYGQGVATCDQQPSAREVYHAQLAYQSSPIGTTTALPYDRVPIKD